MNTQKAKFLTNLVLSKNLLVNYKQSRKNIMSQNIKLAEFGKGGSILRGELLPKKRIRTVYDVNKHLWSTNTLTTIIFIITITKKSCNKLRVAQTDSIEKTAKLKWMTDNFATDESWTKIIIE